MAIKQATHSIQDIPTSIVCIPYTNKTLVIITQTGRIGALYTEQGFGQEVLGSVYLDLLGELFDNLALFVSLKPGSEEHASKTLKELLEACKLLALK